MKSIEPGPNSISKKRNITSGSKKLMIGYKRPEGISMILNRT